MRSIRLGVGVCGAVLCSLVLAPSALGAVFTVNSTGDTGDNTPADDVCATAIATCTLRAAIEESNSTPATTDSINFLSTLTGPIAIGSTLAITSPVSIVGNGSGTGTSATIVDGDDTFRLLSITSAGTPTVALRGMRFRDGGLDDPVGAGGAAILTSENTSLANVVVTSNQITGDGDATGAGIRSSDATTTLALSEGTAVTQNTINLDTGSAMGGGVYSAGPLTLATATVSGNSVAAPGGAQGGGAFGGAAVTVNSSTFSANGTDATGSGGGLFAGSPPPATRSVVNSTFSGNGAGTGGGGGAVLGGTSTVTNSTFALNTDPSAPGAGLDLRAPLLGTITVKNTIIGSSTAAAACFEEVGGNIQSAAQGFNIDAGTSCGFGTTGGNQQNANPSLAPLAANGGGTDTHALLTGSPALDAADPAGGCGAGILTDQRGVLRPQGFRCDIGSFELQNFTLGLTLRGSGSGSVSSSPAGIACRPDCSQDYLPGTLVTLTANPASGSSFAGWGGCDSAAGNQCAVSLGTFAAGADRFVTATFTANPTTQPPTTGDDDGKVKGKKKCRKGKKRKGNKCVKKKGKKRGK